MTGHTYLLKSRHGVYYFRAVIPREVRAKGGRREVRISLRTKDRAKAKVLVALKALSMTKTVPHLEHWELEEHERLERYQRGLALIEKHGEIDFHDPLAVDLLGECLNVQEFQDYIFAHEHRARLATRNTTPLKAASMATIQSAGQVASQQPKAPTASAPPTNVFDELIDIAIDRFVGSKKLAVSAPTAEKYGAQCRVFLKIISDDRVSLKLSSLTPKDLRHYVDTLPKLPTRIDSSDDRPLEEILKTAGPRLSAKTIFAHAQATNMFLAWCDAQQYPVQFNFHGILKPLLKKPKLKAKTKSFSQDQLRTLFEAPPYLAGSFKRPSDYWVPLLGLFTGAREAELCQLETDDVRLDPPTGLWLLDINSDEDKKLKTDTSEREVPIHPTLLALGFLDFVEGVRASNETRLFKVEQRNKRGEFSGFSKRFNRYKEGLGIKSNANHKLDFHSFRHTLQTILFDAGEEEYIINALCGHTNAQQSEGVRTYSKGPGLQAKIKVLLKLHYLIDFHKIKPNGWAQD
jgi:integrase